MCVHVFNVNFRLEGPGGAVCCSPLSTICRHAGPRAAQTMETSLLFPELLESAIGPHLAPAFWADSGRKVLMRLKDQQVGCWRPGELPRWWLCVPAGVLASPAAVPAALPDGRVVTFPAHQNLRPG